MIAGQPESYTIECMRACVRACMRASECVYGDDDDEIIPATSRVYVGGCKGRMMIDIFDHTHWKHILQCRCLVFGSFAVLSSMPPWWSDSAQGLQHP